MLFELTDNLCTYQPDDKAKVITGITNLLIGYYEGNHLLTLSDDFYDTFEPEISDERAKQALRYLYNYETYDYHVPVSYKIVLNDNCKRSELPISYFRFTRSIQPIPVLAENPNDVEFYALVTRIIKKVDKDRLAYNSMHGSGYSMGVELAKLQDSKILSLAIADSDIKFPGGTVGATGGAVQTAYTKGKYVRLEVIKVHEIENLLPPLFIYERCKDEGKSLMEKFIKKGLLDYLRYYDVKNGISTGDIEEPGYDTFAKDIYEHIYNVKKCTYERHVRQCKKNNKKIHPKLKDDLIKKFLKLNFTKQIAYQIHFKDEWREIADNFYQYACSRVSEPIHV
jgi:hypothetical protein